MNDPKIASSLSAIANRIGTWIYNGIDLPIKGGEAIYWRSRELNYGADSLCERVLDSKSNVLETHPNLKEYIANRANLFIQSDGGCRGDGISATGWRIRASHPGSRKCITVASGGSIVQGNLNSLHVEALAMHEATRFLDRLLR